ncbi:tRNA (adenosine(37)-N6)-dimethylallyltransferase MiaA [Tenacibaculum sp. 1_MG-2023]|uniref:tRNA (adenosine(37)-N6)-dimethylallyltransferase MiaA n=1 Tax=Tenacibaculum sp. 1_MG-2023 TaxID=3062653 RepID=UPI0026E35B9B|nr:tRNA (adenosine(37)-N6)-dimethylallyltransferase MiaA [Tenacibaculum sp. 1_MG-2023]MDO6599767.1 tRNA (adenosine(37)-N6)-dimethylallyltransferase MiaA [Tenacibaculum sp. 1_MG-2023]
MNNLAIKNTLITIVGPTAIGKTALSIKLANTFSSDIISCDSRQFFKEMNIGTAVPDTEELAAAKHHFIQNISIFEEYSVGQFEKDALKKLDSLFEQNPIQIMVGGSGLYVDAVLKGLDYFPKISPEIRTNLNNELIEKGLEYLQLKLKDLDPETYSTITLDNPKRVTRALEICIGTGKTYSSFINKPKAPRNFNSIVIGLSADREILYNRINQRVDFMIENGLVEEAQKLHQHKELNALKTVGYRELFNYFEGNFTKEFAISEIKKNTRRFAKRQGTWFRRDKNILWFDYQTDVQKIISNIKDKI